MSNDHNLTPQMVEQRVRVNLSWTRPNNIPYPNIWHRYEAKSRDGKTYKIKIEDVAPNRFEEFLDFTLANFDYREPAARSIEIWSDPETISARRALRQRILEQKVCLIATLDDEENNNGNPKIMGIIILFVASKNDPPFQFTGKKWKLLTNFFYNYAKKDINPFQILDSDTHFDDCGVSVAPEYYGLGLGFHLLSCVSHMGKAWNIPGYMSIFTYRFSQSIAEKLGFKLCKETSYDEYKDENGEKILPVEGTIKYMVWKIDK